MVKNGTLASPAMARASKRLTGAGRADQQRAFRNFAAEALELARVFQELDDLAELFLGFIDAGDILERDAALGFGEQLGFRAAKAHGAAATAALHLAHEEEPRADQQQHGQDAEQNIANAGAALRALRLHLHIGFVQPLNHIRHRALRQIGDVIAIVARFDRELIALRRD